MRTREPKKGVSPDSRYQTEICPTALPQDAAGLHSEQGTAYSTSLTLLKLQTGNNHHHHQWGANTDGFQLPRPTEVDQLNNFAGLTPAVKHCTELISYQVFLTLGLPKSPGPSLPHRHS